MEDPSPIKIVSIAVRRDRIVCELELPDERCRYTDSQMAQRILENYPALARHACVNAEGRTFGCVMERTSIPHLIEHMAIELQTRVSTDPDATFVGTSEWLDEKTGRACVQLSYRDDLEALHALKAAAETVASLI